MAYGGVTGYTAGIVDGSIKNASEFLKLCIRAFMCCFDQRDDSLYSPLVTEFKADEYYFRSCKQAEEDLEQIENMTFDDIKAKYIKEERERIEHDKRMYERMVDEYAKYKRILDEVEAWIPPTDEHEGIKKFAIEQIKMCMPTEEEIEDSRQKANSKINVSDDDIKEYYNDILECAKRHVKIRRETLNEQIKSAQSRTEFMRAFLVSLPE